VWRDGVIAEGESIEEAIRQLAGHVSPRIGFYISEIPHCATALSIVAVKRRDYLSVGSRPLAARP